MSNIALLTIVLLMGCTWCGAWAIMASMEPRPQKFMVVAALVMILSWVVLVGILIKDVANP